MEEPQSPAEVLAALLAEVESVGHPDVNLAPPQLHLAFGALQALAATGALSLAETERWRERLEREMKRLLELPEVETLIERLSRESPPPAAPEELRRRARRLMQEAVEDIRSSRELDRWQGGEARYSAASRAYGALDALRLAGLLDDAGYDECKGSIEEALELQAPGPPAVQTPSVAEAAEVEAELQVSSYAEPPQMRVQPPEPVFRGDRLRRALIVDEAGATDHPYLIELYEDGVIVHRTMPWDPEDDSRFHARIELGDDVDTEYRFEGGGGGNRGRDRLKYEHVFTPAPPPQATRLELTVESELWIIPLGDAGDPRFSVRGAGP